MIAPSTTATPTAQGSGSSKALLLVLLAVLVAAAWPRMQSARADEVDATSSDTPRHIGLAEAHPYMREVAAHWREHLHESLAPILALRDAIANDPALHLSMASGNRADITDAVRLHSIAALDANILVFDAVGAPLSLVRIDRNGQTHPEPLDRTARGLEECRGAPIAGILGREGKPALTVFKACDEERTEFAHTHVLVGFAPMSKPNGGLLGFVAVVTGLAPVQATLAAAHPQIAVGYHLSLLLADGTIVDDASDEYRSTAAPSWLRPTVGTTEALAAAAYHASEGLYFANGDLEALVLPLPELRVPIGEQPALLLCADPTVLRLRGVASTSGGPLSSGVIALMVVLSATVGIGVWILARRSLKETALAARAAVEESNLERHRLISGVSHDIRGPLGAIVGYTELLRSDAHYRSDETLRQQAFDAITRSCAFIVRLTDHLLDLRSAAMGKLTVESRMTDVLAICRECVATYQLEAADKGFAIAFVHTDIAQLEILSDPTRLRQIVQNLVGNAVRYTDRGAVVVSLSIPAAAPDLLEITVTDTGIGIPQRALDNIFLPFFRVQAEQGKECAGKGLGLAVVKTIVDALGGTIAVSSVQGQGSCFTLRLPAKRWIRPDASAPLRALKVAGELADAAPSHLLEGLNIAFADDYEDARAITGRLLRSAGATVSVFASGADLLQAIQCGLETDCVLLDLQMPGMTGHETAVALRKTGCTAPMIALSAISDEATRARSAVVGFAFHLSKPGDPIELQTRIAEAVGRKPMMAPTNARR